jgi:hypothetical protein
MAIYVLSLNRQEDAQQRRSHENAFRFVFVCLIDSSVHLVHAVDISIRPVFRSTFNLLAIGQNNEFVIFSEGFFDHLIFEH